MNKRGQVYILAAILFAVIIYGLSTVPNIVMQQEFKGDFDKLADNYEIESSKLVNSVLLSKGDILDSFTNFSLLFMSYSKSQNPGFGMVTSLSHENKVRIGNYLKKPIIIDYPGAIEPDYLNGCFDKISALMVFNGLVIDLTTVEMQEVQECFIDLPYKEKIWIGFIEQKEPLEVVWYPFEIKPNKPQLMIVNMQEEARQKQVSIAGEGYVKEEIYEVSESRIKKSIED